MSIFDLHSAVLADYRDFVRSFFMIADDMARAYVDQALVDEARLWPDFLLQVSPSYPRTATVDELCRRGELHEEAGRIFQTPGGEPHFWDMSKALKRFRHVRPGPRAVHVCR
jgi:hypothetical protein